jgi:hypothetical protein
MKLGKYQHYKGKFYEVLGVAIHSETRENLVVYKALYDDPELGNEPLFVRPELMFTENVVIETKRVPRFRRVDQ